MSKLQELTAKIAEKMKSHIYWSSYDDCWLVRKSTRLDGIIHAVLTALDETDSKTDDLNLEAMDLDRSHKEVDRWEIPSLERGKTMCLSDRLMIAHMFISKEKATRCSSKGELTTGIMKRCIRQMGHNEDHIWAEAENRSDGLPIFVRWNEKRDFWATGF